VSDLSTLLTIPSVLKCPGNVVDNSPRIKMPQQLLPQAEPSAPDSDVVDGEGIIVCHYVGVVVQFNGL
jgi:hypothetical protein